jgi:DNA-binding MarR family transcriptional regulator
LIRAQAKLELDALDLAILLNLILHWWTPKDWPYPPPRILANRIGVSIRTIERRLESLEQRGFLIRHPSEKSPEGLAHRRIELTPLVVRLQAFARAGLAMSYARKLVTA